MSRTWLCGVLVVIALASVGATPRLVHAQDLPPELSGDYTDLPPPPRPRVRPRPVDDESENPEFGDVGPPPAEEEESATDPAPNETVEEQDASDAAVSEVDAQDTSEDDRSTTPRGTRYSASLSFGVGTLAFTRPAAGGSQTLPPTAFAAAGFDVRAHFGHANALSFEALAAYQTSIGLVVESDPLFALPENVKVRAQRLELSLAPRLRLSDSVAVALPIGFATHLFTPEVHQYPLDPYSLGGVMVRAEFIVGLGERVSLRVGPEVQWLLMFNRSLTREGVCCSGAAIGGQATLQTSLGSVFSLALNYRELRSVVPVAARFTDVERVMTARLVGEL